MAKNPKDAPVVDEGEAQASSTPAPETEVAPKEDTRGTLVKTSHGSFYVKG
jgi:hypothetical protein